jgi:hypothetical protein
MNFKTIGYWVATALVGLPLAGSGLRYIFAEMPEALGIPAYFWTVLGPFKVLGVLAIVVPGAPLLKEWAYAGFFFLLTGAAASHLLYGDGLLTLAPLTVLAIGSLSYLLRPSARRLPSSPTLNIATPSDVRAPALSAS